jgi:hypothetical protein
VNRIAQVIEHRYKPAQKCGEAGDEESGGDFEKNFGRLSAPNDREHHGCAAKEANKK